MAELPCLPVRNGAAAAVQYFNHPRLLNLYGLFSQEISIADSDDNAPRALPYIERLWMPAYAVCFRTVLREAVTFTWMSVDAWTDQVNFIDVVDDIEQADVQEKFFPPHLGESQACEIARHRLMQFILRQRGQFNKPVIESMVEVRPHHYPVWVCYFRRWNKSLDLKVFDAYTGKPGGAKMRAGVLNALVASKKAARTE
jgi:hypothetical protein